MFALKVVPFQLLFSASNAHHDHLGVSVPSETAEVRSASHDNRIASHRIDKHELIVSVAVPSKPVMYHALLNFNMSAITLSGFARYQGMQNEIVVLFSKSETCAHSRQLS
jgi:hypothetical protein